MNQQHSPPPLPYQGFVPPPLPPSKPSPEKIFTGLLIALAVILTLVIAQFSFMRAGGKLDIEPWLFHYLIFTNSLYLISIIIALLVRLRSPTLRRPAAVAVSIILLFFFPFGTIVGIYGLMKVDRQPQA